VESNGSSTLSISLSQYREYTETASYRR
jgi:hypothetical protein